MAGFPWYNHICILVTQNISPLPEICPVFKYLKQANHFVGCNLNELCTQHVFDVGAIIISS